MNNQNANQKDNGINSKNRFIEAVARKNPGRPPVWFMRQAGRYHGHYQKIRARHSFMEMCKNPDLACEITFGPLDDFDFDAAILFSDLLFPLEALGMGLRYEPGPKLEWHLTDRALLSKLKLVAPVRDFMDFQAQALKKIRNRLIAENKNHKGLIGFVGGPWTLFCYAAQGSHVGDLSPSIAGLADGRYGGFLEHMVPLLTENMQLQAQAGADAVAIFDTCGGEVDATTFREHVVPALSAVMAGFKVRCPDTPVIYYSKKTTPAHWRNLSGLPIAVLGVDWRHDLVDVVNEFGDRYAIQGNMDPDWLSEEPAEFEKKARAHLERIIQSGMATKGWVSGLGHGCTPSSKETNVRRFVQLMAEYFSD
jgi:uroporphyrinogen decarboxylase